MKNETNKTDLYGVDRDYVEAIIRKARRERNLAIWAMLDKVFSKPKAKDARPVEPVNGAAAKC